MPSSRPIITALSFVFLASACITPSEKKQMKDDLFNAQTRLLNLERLLADNSKEGKSNSEAAIKRIAGTQAELERIGTELQKLHGDIDELRVGVTSGQLPGVDPAQQENSVAAQLAKISERMTAVEQAQEELLDAIHKAGVKGSKKKDQNRDAGGAEKGGKSASNAQELQRAFDDKYFKQVTEDGERLLKENGTKDKETVRFLVAESYFKQGKFREAALNYGEFLEKKPPKKLVATAKMHIADAFKKLGDTSTANVYYEELIKEFPNSSEAEHAKERLAGGKSAASKG